VPSVLYSTPVNHRHHILFLGLDVHAKYRAKSAVIVGQIAKAEAVYLSL
jgi:hypothetical protein